MAPSNLPDDVVDAGIIVPNLPLHLGVESGSTLPSLDDLIEPAD